jgi:hypothetical protein
MHRNVTTFGISSGSWNTDTPRKKMRVWAIYCRNPRAVSFSLLAPYANHEA